MAVAEQCGAGGLGLECTGRFWSWTAGEGPESACANDRDESEGSRTKSSFGVKEASAPELALPLTLRFPGGGKVVECDKDGERCWTKEDALRSTMPGT